MRGRWVWDQLAALLPLREFFGANSSCGEEALDISFSSRTVKYLKSIQT